MRSAMIEKLLALRLWLADGERAIRPSDLLTIWSIEEDDLEFQSGLASALSVPLWFRLGFSKLHQSRQKRE